MATTAFWKSLYTVGHDAACLTQTDDGWILEGTTVYLNGALPTALNYRLDLRPDWATSAGSVTGRVGDRRVDHTIRKEGSEWLLNDVRQAGLEGVLDLDFGFTPATNHAQLRRMDLGLGEQAEIIVAWMDVDSVSLEPLPQIYKRLSDRTYDYNSPQGPYKAVLELEETGFVKVYPELWQTGFN